LHYYTKDKTEKEWLKEMFSTLLKALKKLEHFHQINSHILDTFRLRKFQKCIYLSNRFLLRINTI